MNNKSARISRLTQSCHGQPLDPHYLGFFECFNQQLFFEAHEVLESLWLPQRHGQNGNFYKGLIQLAGAFVHVQKGRAGPAAALFRLAQSNLGSYPALHQSLDLSAVQTLISRWVARLQDPNQGPLVLTQENAPHLALNRTD